MKLPIHKLISFFAVAFSTEVFAAELFATTGFDLGNYELFNTQRIPGIIFGAGMEFDAERFSSFEHFIQLGSFGSVQNVQLEQVQLGEMRKGQLNAWNMGATLSGGSRWHLNDNFSLGALLHFDYGFAGNIQSSLGVINFNQKVDNLTRYGIRAELRRELTQKMSTFFALGINQGNLKTTENSTPTTFANSTDLGNIKFTGYQFLINGSYAM
ncbi:MAG: hypothetical protein RL189_775 [Pseudomonadota bacterium]|jgi:hypothetical protein